MAYTTDTNTISFDLPVPEGIIKELQESTPWDADMAQETSDINLLEQEAESIPLKPTFVSDRPLGFTEWLSIAAATLSKTLVTTLAATQINLARLSSDPQGTVAFDPSSIFEVIMQERSTVVSVSPSLIMGRFEVGASSLLAPSGAYLAWLEMLAEEGDG